MAPDSNFNEKLEVLTKEVTICKLLTSNDLKVRKRGISFLKKWFREIGQKKIIDESDYDRIWNGLFYYVWMSDKPLVQEETAESISGMIHLIESYESAIYFVRGFFRSLVKQWDRISHYRIDKFLMFVRRFLRQTLIMLRNNEWSLDKVESLSSELHTAVQILPYSLALHLNEIFNEELAKVSQGKISTEALIRLLKGFTECIANLKPNMQVVNSINSNIFGGLVRQLKLYIKQKAVADDCDNENTDEGQDFGDGEGMALDPRPGGVNVYLPYIEFDENDVVNFLKSYLSKAELPIKAKNILNQIIDMFTSITRLRASMSNPEHLIKETVQENPRKRKNKKEKLSTLIKKSCRRLEEEEDEYEDEREAKILKKLRTMSDIIQIPAGKSTFTVFKTKSKPEESPKKTVPNDWTVSDVEVKESSPKKPRTSGNKDEWIVEEVSKPVEEESAGNTILECDDVDESFKLEISMSEDVADKVEEKQVTKSPSIHIVEQSETVTHQVEEKQVKKSGRVSFVENPQIVSYASDSESKTQADDSDVVESVTVVPSSVVDGKPNLLKKDEDYLVVDFTSQSNEENNVQLDTKHDSKEKSNEISESNETASQIENAEWQTVPSEIVVELTSDLKNTSKPDESSEKLTRQLRGKKTETKATEVNTRVLRTKTIEIQPEPGTPSKRTRSQKVEEVESSTESLDSIEPKKSKKLRDKKGESVIERKSLRIAERQRKVHFNLDENSSQDILAYEKSVKSKADVSYRGSPIKSILKPSAVSSPINPFYFPNGERKLKRKRK